MRFPSGRAEVILGRGSFTESYPLFGYDMSLYEQLFEEKLALFAELLKPDPVSWSGRTRSPLAAQTVYPPIENGTLRTWVGVGGSPESVVRAARHGLPLTLAIIGGDPLRFLPYAQLYRQSLEQLGRSRRCRLPCIRPDTWRATDEAGARARCGRTTRR